MNKRSVRGVALGLMLSVVVAQAQTATNFFYWTNTSATATTPWSSNNYWTNGYPVALGGTNVVLNFSATNAAYSSSNDFAGNFVLNGLTFGAGTVTLRGGQLVFTNNGATMPLVTNYSGNTATINNNITLGTSTTFGVVTTNITLGGIVSGSGGLIKTGTGSLTLSTNNTFTGGLTLYSGTLFSSTTGGNMLGLGSVTIYGGTLDASGASAITITGVTNYYFNGSFSLGNAHSATLNAAPVLLGTNITVTVPSFSGTINGNISDGGLGYSLTKAGGGTLTLTGANTYSGGTFINLGTLNLSGGANRLSTNGAITIMGGTLNLGGNIQYTTNLVTFAGGVVANGTLSNNITAYAGQSGTVVANLAGSAGLIKSTTGTLTLSGTNTYAGGTTISGGTLLFSSTNAMATASFTVGSGTGVGVTYALDQNFLGRIDVASVGVAVMGANTSSNLDFSAATGANLASVSLGAYGTVTNSGTITPYGTTYRLGGGGGTQVLANVDQLTGSNSLVAFGGGSGGTLSLSASNSFSGGVTLGVGTLALNDAYALGTGALVINGGALDAGGNGITNGNNNAININSNFTFTGTKNLDLGTGAVTLGGSITVTNTASTLTIGGSIGDGGYGYGLTKTGAGTLVLTGSNTYTGPTVLGGTGTTILSNTLGGVTIPGNVQIGSGTNCTVYLGSDEQIANTAVVTFGAASSYGRFALVGHNETVGGLVDLVGTGGIVENNDSSTAYTNAGPSTLTINVSTATNYVYAGYLRNYHASGAGPSNTLYVIKDGLGTQTLAGGNIANGGAGGGAIAGLTILNGTLALSNTANFSATVNISGGQLLLLTANAVQSGTITNNAPNGLAFGLTNAFTLGSLNGNSTGTITLSNDTGVAVTLTVGNGNRSGVYAGSLGGSGLLITTGTGTMILSGNNSFSGILTNSGSGALTLSGSNTFGGVTLTAGTLNINNPGALGPNTFTLTGGTLDNTSGAPIILTTATPMNWNADVTFTGTTNLNLGTGLVTLGTNRTVTVTANTLTVPGVISDGGGNYSLTKAGNGTLVLTATNIYIGGTTVSNGTLALGADNVLGTGTLILSSGGSATLTSDGSAARTLTNALTIAGTVNNFFGQTNGGTGTLNLNGPIYNGTAAKTWTVNNSTTIVNGVISGLSSATLTKAGNGLLVLAGANSLTANITNSAGTLAVGASNGLGTATLVMNGGTLGVANGGNWIQTNTVNLKAANNTVDTTGGNLLLSGTLMNTGTLVKVGLLTTLTLSGANFYSGATIVSSGALNIQNATALGTTDNGATVQNNARIELQGGITVSGKQVTVNGYGGTNFYDGALNSKSGSNTWAGPVTIGSASTRIGAEAGAILQVSGVIDSSGNNYGLTIRPNDFTATVILSGSNTYVGDTTIFGGLTKLDGGDNRLPTGTTLKLGYANVSGGFDLNGRNQQVAGLAIAQTSGTYANFVTNSSVTTSMLSVYTSNGVPSTFSGSLGGNLTLTKIGADVLTFSSANTYNGGTLISNGTLKVASGGSLSSSTTVYVDNLGIMDFSGNIQTIAGLTGNGVVTNGGGNLTINLVSATNTFGGTLKGASTLTLTGGGTLLMTGTNSFGGASVISNGSTYVVNGLHNGALITAYAGSTVGGSGLISSNLLVNGGIYQPGYGGVLTQTVAKLTLTNSGTLAIALGQTNNPAYATVTSQLTLAGTNNYLRLSNLGSTNYTSGKIYLVDYSSAKGAGFDYTNNYFRLADNFGSVIGPNDGWALTNNMQFSVVGGGSATNLFTINYDDLANGVITLTAVPEPGTASLLGLIGVAFLVRRLRRRTQS